MNRSTALLIAIIVYAAVLAAAVYNRYVPELQRLRQLEGYYTQVVRSGVILAEQVPEQIVDYDYKRAMKK